jgi:enoyl-CoA hydratase
MRPVTYQQHDFGAVITLDDGKVNALSLPVQRDLLSAFDHAVAEGALVVLTGRTGTFSGGFDLKTIAAGGADAAAMIRGGFELAERLLGFPRPVVIACSGHAIAMGAFLLVSADYRIGADGPFRITANEVSIGMTLPRAPIVICRERLSPAYVSRALLLAEPFSPVEALAAGFLDRVVPAAELLETAFAIARQLNSLNRQAHTATKAKVRAHLLAELRSAIEQDDADLRALMQASPGSAS